MSSPSCLPAGALRADTSDIAGTGVAMTEVMNELASAKSKDVLALLVSGAGGRSVLPKDARPLMRVRELAPSPQVADFAASQAEEISGSAPGESGGVFTKYVTRALGTGEADENGDGAISLRELSDWVSPRVAHDAKTANREQHPKLVVGSGLGDPATFMVEYGLSR